MECSPLKVSFVLKTQLSKCHTGNALHVVTFTSIDTGYFQITARMRLVVGSIKIVCLLLVVHQSLSHENSFDTEQFQETLNVGEAKTPRFVSKLRRLDLTRSIKL